MDFHDCECTCYWCALDRERAEHHGAGLDFDCIEEDDGGGDAEPEP